MFGLMKARVCSQPEELRQHRRLHYCGTCKTIGRQYSQHSRFLLNNDAVFLAELLSALCGADRELENWNSAYRSYNCLSLPAATAEMPISLQFAAAAALISAEFKVADALVDSGGLKWKAANRIFSSDFLKASERLTSWGVPLDQLWQCSKEQQIVEAAAIANYHGAEPIELLEQLSRPTAQATAILFEHSARVVGCEHAQEAMNLLGRSFGSIIYLLDAVEDYDKDRREGNFNAIQAAFGLSSDIPDDLRSLVCMEFERLSKSFETELGKLPVPKSVTDRFSSRLKANLFRRLGIDLPVAGCACTHANREATPERWRSAAGVAQRIKESALRSASSRIAGALQLPFVCSLAFVIALIFPRQAAEARSFRQCIDIVFNLMFIGSALRPIFGAAANGPSGGGGSGSGPESVFPPGYTPPSPNGPQHSKAPEPGKESRKGSGGCSVCCCDCGDCCDCCDCADCCSGCDCC